MAIAAPDLEKVQQIATAARRSERWRTAGDVAAGGYVGAAIGTAIVPVIGTLIGAGIGGMLGAPRSKVQEARAKAKAEVETLLGNTLRSNAQMEASGYLRRVGAAQAGRVERYANAHIAEFAGEVDDLLRTELAQRTDLERDLKQLDHVQAQVADRLARVANVRRQLRDSAEGRDQ